MNSEWSLKRIKAGSTASVIPASSYLERGNVCRSLPKLFEFIAKLVTVLALSCLSNIWGNYPKDNPQDTLSERKILKFFKSEDPTM